MPDHSSVTLNLSDEDSQRLAQLVAETGRSASAIVADALHAYLDVQAWQLEEILKGLAEADAGDFASPEEVERCSGNTGERDSLAAPSDGKP